MNQIIMPFMCALACSPEQTCELLDGAPTCVIKECPSPGPSNSTQFIGNRRHVGSQVYYTCKNGYRLLPSIISPTQTSTCQPTGTWTFVTIACEFVVNCGPLVLPVHGWVHYTGGTLLGSVVTFWCDVGYYVSSGHATRQCDASGQWSGTYAVCSAIDCGIPPTLTNGQVQHTGGTLFGAVATFTCDVGYSVSSGGTTRQCATSGVWSGTDVVCSAITCPVPTAVTNGVVTFNGNTYGSTVYYTCHAGYSGSTPGTRTCTSAGSWSGTIVACSPDCEQLNTPENMPENARVTWYSGYKTGNRIQYSCNDGYRRTSGNLVRQCMPSGSWSYGALICRPIDCGTPHVRSNSQVTAPNTTWGNPAHYSCNEGYDVIAGNSVRYCRYHLFAFWNGTALQCGLADPPCSDLSASGVADSLTNVAANKPVQMSSQFNEYFSPDRLVDGVLSTYAATNNNLNPWMQIDLEAEFAVKAIRLVNRADCCQASLCYIRIYLGDGTTMTHRAVAYDAIVQTECTFVLTATVTASHVKIERLGHTYLTIAEMQVFA